MDCIDLRKLTSDFNTVEIFVCQKKKDDAIVDVKISRNQEDIIRNIENRFNNAKETAFKSYYMKDKIYTYEIGNDNQIVSSKHNTFSQYMQRPKKSADLFLVASKIEKYPPYIFACTNEIDHSCSYTLREFKINNRVSIIIKTEEDFRTVFIEYRHSPNVEIDKMNEIINRLLKIM